MLEARSVDIVMIDLLRVGGIASWMKVAGMAEAFNLPAVSHLLPEVHVHLVAAAPNGLTVQYMPRSLEQFRQAPGPEKGRARVPEKGELAVPVRPGLGLEFDPDVLARYGVRE